MELLVNMDTLSKMGAAAICAGLLSLAVQAQAAEPTWAMPPLSQQCGLTLDPQVDAAAKPYQAGLVAVGGVPASWGDALCTEAAAAKGDDGMHRLKAVLGAHLLHQMTTRDTLNAAQRKAIGQAIDRAKVRAASRDQALELVYVDVRSNAALANVSADGLAYDLKDKAPAVAKTLGGFAERWGP